MHLLNALNIVYPTKVLQWWFFQFITVITLHKFIYSYYFPFFEILEILQFDLDRFQFVILQYIGLYQKA